MLASVFQTVLYALALAFFSALLLWILPGACLAAGSRLRGRGGRLGRGPKVDPGQPMNDASRDLWPRFSGPA